MIRNNGEMPVLRRARKVPLSAGAWSGRLVSRAYPIARYLARGCGSRADGPAAKSGHDDALRARTCKRTWSLPRATWAHSRRDGTLQRGDLELPREHPTTCAGTVRRFSGAWRQFASWCSGADRVAADTSDVALNSSATLVSCCADARRWPRSYGLCLFCPAAGRATHAGRDAREGAGSSRRCSRRFRAGCRESRPAQRKIAMSPRGIGVPWNLCRCHVC